MPGGAGVAGCGLHAALVVWGELRRPSGEKRSTAGAGPALGLGTWRMDERPEARRTELAAIRRAFDAGMALIRAFAPPRGMAPLAMA